VGAAAVPAHAHVELSGLFTLPSQRRQRLIYTADAVGVERLIEAVLARRARNPLLPLRDAALLAAMGFTVASRPSEWLHSATWADLYERTVEFQRPTSIGAEDLERLGSEVDEPEEGLKTGARAALLFANARDRLLAYRSELEARHGPQSDSALVFQALGREGPLWSKDGTPVPWSVNDHKRWAARIWRPARERAAKAPDVPKGVAKMRFYDLRHTAISMALHSTLAMTRHGMDLHNLAAWAGRDVETLQRRYSHIIARFRTAARPIGRNDARSRAAVIRLASSHARRSP
jgi:hypothetical protein